MKQKSTFFDGHNPKEVFEGPCLRQGKMRVVN